MEPTSDGQSRARTYIIRRSQHLGYGFVAGHESPTMVKMIEPNGPSYKRLQPGDVIMAVNGINVEHFTRDKIIDMIRVCGDQLEITVRQATYEELIRAKNLADPKFYTLNKFSSPPSTTNHYQNNLNQHYQPHQNPPALPPNQSPFNRLVTSISQQHQHLSNSPNSPYSCNNLNNNSSNYGETPPVQIFKPTSQNVSTVLKQKPNNGTELDADFSSKTLGRNHNRFGRGSPIPQRCKSSMDGGQNGHGGGSNKKGGDADHDQPLLKRSNTMRPIRAPQKFEEIFGNVIVIKIFFEIGHYRVLTYNQDTTVKAILETLNARLVGDSPNSEQVKKYFGLALTVGINTEGKPKEQMPTRKSLHILDENDSIMKIGKLSYAPRLRLLYRMVYPPTDINTLYSENKVAFEYLYQQSCNDLKLERFCPELDSDTAFKLSALHLLEYIHSNHAKAYKNSKDPKLCIKLIKTDPGAHYFVPASIAEGVLDKKGKRAKKLRERLMEQLKKNFEEFDFEPPKVRTTANLNRYSSTSFHELSLPEMQSSPSDYIKLLFLNYLSQLPCYGTRRPVRASASPQERNTNGDCSSSLESVPRTSDSSPLIKQGRNLSSQSQSGRSDNPINSSISRLAQMNSMRSLNSVQSSSIISQPVDQPDMAQTPSIESISSITFNMQNSPSPLQSLPYAPSQQQVDRYNIMSGAVPEAEPLPMPRQQILASKSKEYNSIEKLYSQRYSAPSNNRSIEDLLKNVILIPPPPPLTMVFDDMSYRMASRELEQFKQRNQLTQVLTDHDIEQLLVPPPPRIYH